jgi:hypothetical protein
VRAAGCVVVGAVRVTFGEGGEGVVVGAIVEDRWLDMVLRSRPNGYMK